MRPSRPFGLTLAILMTTVLFSLLPIIIAVQTWAIRNHFETMRERMIEESNGVIPNELVFGMENLPNVNYVLLAGAIIYLGVAVFAWIGRPAWVRWVMQGMIVLFTLINLITALTPPQQTDGGLSSGQDIVPALLNLQLCFSAFIAFYTLWYINRAPARAFYRGYYLKDPQEAVGSV